MAQRYHDVMVLRLLDEVSSLHRGISTALAHHCILQRWGLTVHNSKSPNGFVHQV